MSQVVTFDFDGTLQLLPVQEYAKELISRGFNVWVVTSRYDDLQKHRYPANATNEDLWEIVDSIGIERHKVRFMCMESKSLYLMNTKAIFHIDNDPLELIEIEHQTNVKAVDVHSDKWKSICEDIISNTQIHV